jgi:hypothetical protein
MVLGGAPWDAKLIKLADIIDNGRVIMKHDRAKAPRFVGEKRMVLQHMQVREGTCCARTRCSMSPPCWFVTAATTWPIS